VIVSDGTQWTNCSFWFITENPETNPPEISSIWYNSSNPIDLEPDVGWENISCTVTDQTNVQNVSISIMYPDSSTVNTTMNRKTHTDTYYYNTTFSTPGNFSFSIWANDTNNNQATSDIFYFILPPNWDINYDRICSMEDLIGTSECYGEQGHPGWIREDIDNDGGIFVFDLVVLSNHYQCFW